MHAAIAERVAALPGRARLIVDGWGGDAVAAGLADRLPALGRVPLLVRGADFLRPAGVRLEHGREDPDAFRDDWLDVAALRREVLESGEWYLPALWDAARDRSARAQRLVVPERGVVIVAGRFLLGLGLPAGLVVHVTQSAAALRRRGVADWRLPAYTSYDELARPAEHCDLLVRAEDPLRPALLVVTPP